MKMHVDTSYSERENDATNVTISGPFNVVFHLNELLIRRGLKQNYSWCKTLLF